MKLKLDSIINEAAAWRAAGVALPRFDVAAMRAATAATPEWVHFGAGNIFRGFIGSLAQNLLNAGLMKTGILACDTFDYDIIDRIYTAQDNLTLNVLLNPDGTDAVSVAFDAPAVGIWTPYGKHAPFVCIEPWYGVHDKVNYQGEFKDKYLMNHLQPGGSFMSEYKITIGS